MSMCRDSSIKQVLRSIIDMEHPTRTALAQRLSISQSFMTKIIGQLQAAHLVYEYASIDSKRGRHPVELRINADIGAAIAVRINRDYVSAAVCTIDGKVLWKTRREISAAGGPETAIRTIIALIREAAAQSPLPVLTVGIALPGPFDVHKGRIAMMSGFPGWEEVDLKGRLGECFDYPVFLDHDANCGARAEMSFGKYRHGNSLVYILCDRGIGAGIILENGIYSNPRGFTGEFGHVSINALGQRCECGNNGCLELYASSGALEREYHKEMFERNRPLEGPVTAGGIYRLVREGDETARRAFARVCKYLAFGTVSLINLLGPETVMFDDRITEGGPFFLQCVKETLKQHLLPAIYEQLVVDVSSLEGDAVMIGASALAFEEILDESLLAKG